MMKIYNYYTLETKKIRNSLTYEQILEAFFDELCLASDVPYILERKA